MYCEASCHIDGKFGENKVCPVFGGVMIHLCLNMDGIYQT